MNMKNERTEPQGSRAHRRRRILLALAVGIFLIILIMVATRLDIAVRTYSQYTSKVSSPIRLAVIADLHSAWYGEKQEVLLETIAAQKPDLLLLVGDIVDDRLPRDGAETLLQQIGRAYPCYYVTGNHEFWSGDVQEIKDYIRSCGIQVLEGDTLPVQVNGETLSVSGVDDPDRNLEDIGCWSRQLDACKKATDADCYSVLLSHRPERVEDYRGSGFDLVLSGHAHGGQVRIPGLVNGIYAPNQGVFPSYAGGEYPLGETKMIVSRGLSKKILPRIANRPELVVVDILPDMILSTKSPPDTCSSGGDSHVFNCHQPYSAADSSSDAAAELSGVSSSQP